MPNVSRIASSALVGLAMLLVPCGSARAQASKPRNLSVLEIDSDDADEQAEALTGALRWRVRSATGWAVLEPAQSLSMLTAALRCPKHPDASCLQRIGNQIKSDRFLWGFVSKSGGHQVTADLHLWTRGKPDVGVREAYTENLRDESDDTLRKVAGRLFDRLTGGPAATLVVRAGGGGGTVTVDGDRTETLDHGVATLFVSGGAHTVEVHATGFSPAREQVVASVGSSVDVNVPLVAEPSSPPLQVAAGSPSSQRVLGWTGIIGGSVLLAVGGALAIVFESSRSTLDTDRQNNYGNSTQGETIENPCSPPPGESNAATTSGCNARTLGQDVLVPEIVALSAGGAALVTGIVLLATDHKNEPPNAVALPVLKRLRLLPQIGFRGASVLLSASF